MKATEPSTTEVSTEGASEPVKSVLRRAAAGDQTALPALREFLHDPAVSDILGNLSRRIVDALVENVAGRDLTFREGLSRRLANMRDGLAGPSPTPMERQLAERVVLCWLAVHEAEYRFAQTRDVPPQIADHWQRRIDHAHRRYLSSVRSLATIRKLAIPVFIGQVNIAGQQANLNRLAIGPSPDAMGG